MSGDYKNMVTRPMKVLFFANTEWYLFNFRLALAKHLRKRGVEVVMISPPGPYGKKLEEEGFRWIPVPMARRSLNPLREAWLLWKLIRIYQTEKPDIVHHFTIKCVVYGGLAARLVGIKGIVGAVAGMGFVFASSSALATMLRPMVRVLLQLALGGKKCRLILQNPDDLNAFVSASIADPANVRLIPGSGVNTDRFSPILKSSASEGSKKVLLAARLLWEKGIAEYIEAAQQLKTLGYSVDFLLAGEPDMGNPNSVQQEQVETWKQAGIIKPVGHVVDMAELLKSIDIMVLPSFYREGVPRSLIEAAAAGLPIVTTDAPGCRDIVENGVNGFLVPVRDSNALAEALRKILEDPALASRMGEAGRSKALAEFDERLVFEKTVEVYRELVPKL
ncbi:MAG: glycosyltransferase family 4 protein [Methylobacter sp.]|uniref:Glycosyltransferase family 4 protein n=1 Tax=Candidatus Methylobacter titanis TaxID=3053457 RepID=A0AA43QA81_9GAMM|nr:glycosyltransferase family 4 protein [Candidatus Methylobacter titanis]